MFLVASDDLKWCRQNFGQEKDVVIIDEGRPEEDLALMTSMEHHIHSYGTFGLFMILLSDFKTVIYPAPYNKRRRVFTHEQFDLIKDERIIKLQFK